MRLKNIFKKHYDLILGFLFFISYKFWFTWLLWQDRQVPPEPDDSYFYLASAANVFNPQNFEGFRLLPFSIWMKFLAIFTQGNLESSYKLNFFTGPLLMFLALFYFLTKLEVDKKIRLFLIVILALYSGSGAYHGFYWVVPSFYQLSLFFIVAGLLIDSKQAAFWKVFLVSLLFIFVHPTSIFISTIFFIFPAFIYFFRRDAFTVATKNAVLILISILFSFTIYYLIGKSYPSWQSPQSFQSNFNLLTDFLKGKLDPLSFSVIWKEYFAIFFFHPLSTVTFAVTFVLVCMAKQFKLLALLFSTLVLVLISSFIPYGSRTLAFLWPLTFIIIGYALAEFYLLLGKYVSKIKALILLPVVLLIFVTSVFNFISIRSINLKNNYWWDKTCPGKIKNQKVGFYSLESSHAFILYGLNFQNSVFLSEDNLPKITKVGSFIVETLPVSQNPEKLTKIEKFLVENITRRSSNFIVTYPTNVWTQKSVNKDLLSMVLNEQGLKLEQLFDCGHFQVEKITKI